jgi:hypothetical protein
MTEDAYTLWAVDIKLDLKSEKSIIIKNTQFDLKKQGSLIRSIRPSAYVHY